jgi:hypothetical protein
VALVLPDVGDFGAARIHLMRLLWQVSEAGDRGSLWQLALYQLYFLSRGLQHPDCTIGTGVEKGVPGTTAEVVMCARRCYCITATCG